MGTHPQALYGVADSPIGLAAWMIDHDLWSMEGISRVFDGDPDSRFGLSRDDVLDNITFYWLTNTGGFVGTHLSGEQARLLRREGSVRPGSRERLP
jgi:hypothetical protein